MAADTSMVRDEAAFLGRDQIDGPLQEVYYHRQRNVGCVMTYLIIADPIFPIVRRALIFPGGGVG
jgi:hypothetical protein